MSTAGSEADAANASLDRAIHSNMLCPPRAPPVNNCVVSLVHEDDEDRDSRCASSHAAATSSHLAQDDRGALGNTEGDDVGGFDSSTNSTLAPGSTSNLLSGLQSTSQDVHASTQCIASVASPTPTRPANVRDAVSAAPVGPQDDGARKAEIDQVDGNRTDDALESVVDRSEDDEAKKAWFGEAGEQVAESHARSVHGTHASITPGKCPTAKRRASRVDVVIRSTQLCTRESDCSITASECAYSSDRVCCGCLP